MRNFSERELRENWSSREPARAAYSAPRASAFHGAVRGAAFESKADRQAVLATIVVGATQDGNPFARARAAFESDIEAEDIHHCMNTAWLFRGGDMTRWIEFRVSGPEQYPEFTRRGRETLRYLARPFASWRNDLALFMGPRQAGFSALDVDVLTAAAIRSHELIAAHLEIYRREAPGFEHAYLLQSAPQLGVRNGRRLIGVRKVTRAQSSAGGIGVTPGRSPRFPNLSIP